MIGFPMSYKVKVITKQFWYPIEVLVQVLKTIRLAKILNLIQ